MGKREDLIRTRLERQGITQRQLGEEVARLLGRDQPYSQTNVFAWLNETVALHPDQVFAIEQVLDWRPGQLSVHFGYLPPNARNVGAGIEAAIRGDVELSEGGKRVLLACYRELRRL